MNLTIESEEELYQENHPFRQMMETLFDAGLLLDGEGKIIYASRHAFPHLVQEASRERLIGEAAQKFDRESPFREVLRTQKPVKGFVLKNALNKSNISHIFPIFCNGRVAGLLCVILVDNLNEIKRALKLVEGTEEQTAKELYNTISRRESAYTFSDFVGGSPAAAELIMMCKKAAAFQYPILITGETGTGKEIIANGIHGASGKRGQKPLVKINCTAIPGALLESELFGHEKGAFTGALTQKKGKFELAENGTILLDEIEAMDFGLQGKLLRVLEEMEFERVGGLKVIPLRARIIASSNQNLKELSRQGKFREDLYYRLNIIEIRIPPLRERREDIALLLCHFQKQQGTELKFTREALDFLYRFEWRGNVRELRNLVIKLSIFYEGRQIGRKDVADILGPVPVREKQQEARERQQEAREKQQENHEKQQEVREKQQEARERQQEAGQKQQEAREKQQENHEKQQEARAGIIDIQGEEKERMLRALERNNCHVTKAALELGISRASFYYKMRKYGIEIRR